MKTLLVIVDAADEALRQAERLCVRDAVTVLNLDADSADRSLPDNWQSVATGELLDGDALRDDFLAFLDAWPRRVLFGGKSFDQLFSRPGGYSLWWTGPGAERHPDAGVFPKLKVLWIADRAIRRHSPERVLIYTRQPDVAHALASRCEREECLYEFLPGSADGSLDPCPSGLSWFCVSLLWLLAWPWYVLVRAVFARLMTPGLKNPGPKNLGTRGSAPSIVYSSEFFRSSQIEQGRVSVCFWDGLRSALAKADPLMQCVYLPTILFPGRYREYRSVGRLYHTGWRLLRQLSNIAPMRERYAALGAQLRTAPSHLAALIRYWRLERTGEYRNSFVFANADVAALYVPSLRRTFSRFGVWAQAVAAITKSIKAVGEVRVVLVTEEMYQSGMLLIAAAKRLGIPVVGVQHGTIFPLHLNYTIPPGHLEGAPAPDYFAAYGQQAKDTVSKYGAFPRDRVWITGSPRFDSLVNDPPDAASARAELGLPSRKKIVLLATQDYPWFQRVAEAVFTALGNSSEHLICVKTHPRDVPLDVYRQIARRTETENVRFFNDHFDRLLTACDVLVSGSSTTVFEAILLGRKAICANFSEEPDRYPYSRDGGALAARSEPQMRESLEHIFREDRAEDLAGRREEFLRQHAGPSAEGRAAETLAGLVLALCRGEKINDTTTASNEKTTPTAGELVDH